MERFCNSLCHPHPAVTRLLRTALERVLPEGWYVESQEPITLEDSEPEPDVFVVKGDTLQYLERHPGAEDIPLVIEIADTTLQRDRTLKKRVYARAGIPVYWLVNLNRSSIEVYSQPSGMIPERDYQQQQSYGPEAEIPVVMDETEVISLAVNSFLPQDIARGKE